MSKFVRTVAITGGIGTLAAIILVSPSWLPLALAQEQQPLQVLASAPADFFGTPFDTDSLVKYDITFDDSISTEVTRTQTVKKIGYGSVETVNIVTTSSGTYSSDALTSPHVLYPGIEVTVKPAYRALQELLDKYGVRALVPLYNNSFVVLLGGEPV